MGNEITTEEQASYDIDLLRKIFNVGDDVPVDQIKIAEQYCKAKGLDPIKKPIAIIPFKKKWKEGNKWMEKQDYQIIPTAESVKVVASRANWAGNDDYIYGQEQEFKSYNNYNNNEIKITAPEWGQVTVYKIVGGMRCAFMGPKVYFNERCSFNTNWVKQPMAMFNKCILTASLRNACPEECAGMYISEELNDDRYQQPSEKIPSIEQAKKENETPLTEEEEAVMKAGIEMRKEPKRKDMTATEAKAKAESKKKKEPEIIEATAKEVVEQMTSAEIADSLVAMIEAALESNDDNAIDFAIGEVGHYKTQKLANPKHTTIDDHNKIAQAFLNLKKVKGIK